MSSLRQQPHTFHLIGNKNRHYFDHDHFMGRDVFSDFWDSHNNRPISIKPKEKDFVINITLPGYKEEEIEVTHAGNRVNVSACISEKNVGLMVDEYLLKELHMGGFLDTFNLPDGLDIDHMHHTYDGKNLKISIPYTLQ